MAVVPTAVASAESGGNEAKQNLLSSNLFTPSIDEDEEFRVTVETMGKKRRLSIFKDAMEDSPGKAMHITISTNEANSHKGRTESPLEEHRYESQYLNLWWRACMTNSTRFDFSHGLPLENASSNMIVHTSPRTMLSPLVMRFGGKENMQPDYLNRRSGVASAPGNVYPPHAFHEHTANPLIYNPYSYSFGFGESPAFHGDFKSPQSGFTRDFKPAVMPGSFRESNSTGRQNQYANNGLSYAM